MKIQISVLLPAVVLLATSGCATTTLLTKQAAAVSNGPESSLSAASPLKSANPERLAEVCIQTAKQLAQREQYAAAIEQFERAGQLNPTLNVHHELAVLHGLAANRSAAQTHFQRAIDAAPKDGALLSDFGFFLYSIGETDAAERQLRSALTLSDEPSTRANLACVLGSTGRYDEAAQLLSSMDTGDDANYSLALLAARVGDVETARHYCEAAATQRPDSEPVAALSERLATHFQ